MLKKTHPLASLRSIVESVYRTPGVPGSNKINPKKGEEIIKDLHYPNRDKLIRAAEKIADKLKIDSGRPHTMAVNAALSVLASGGDDKDAARAAEKAVEQYNNE